MWLLKFPLPFNFHEIAGGVFTDLIAFNRTGRLNGAPNNRNFSVSVVFRHPGGI